MSSMWDFEAVKDRIKKHEGYRDTVYEDHLGNATIGYGHLITPTDVFRIGQRYSRKSLERVFEYDFNIAKKDMNIITMEIYEKSSEEQPIIVKEIIIEMCFQMGRTRVTKFKNMIKAIKDRNYKKAADEMLDSNWAKQTFHRAHDLSELMRNA